MNISIIGSGYVGLVSSACFAELGNQVICADNDSKKINDLKQGIVSIYEPGLEELIISNLKNKRLKFTSSIKEAVRGSKVIFITIGTPALESVPSVLANRDTDCCLTTGPITGIRSLTVSHRKRTDGILNDLLMPHPARIVSGIPNHRVVLIRSLMLTRICFKRSTGSIMQQTRRRWRKPMHRS